MNLIGEAMRRPITIVVAILSLLLGSIGAVSTMKEDIFPDLNIPAIYVVQEYGGMAPDQMEGYIVSTYEMHFLYIPGVTRIESKSIQNLAMIKVYFNPGADMAQAMATCVAMVDRARSLMPPGTITPFVLRFDAGSLPVGQLVLSSKTKTIDQLQDLAFVRIRGILATIRGAMAPPPFGGNARTIVINVNSDKLRQFNLGGDEVVQALASGNMVTPAGNVRIGDFMRIAPINTDLPNIKDLEYLPVRVGAGPTVFIRDIGTISDASDILAGYALYQGRRTVYMPVIKTADASTMTVVNQVRTALPHMKDILPPDVDINYEFDQSKAVQDSILDVIQEGALGAILPGVMILLFLRDIRSTIIVVTTIPCALMGALISLYFTGQTINIQTLSGLALAIGILVDEATVNIENIHTHLARDEPLTRAVLAGGTETMVPRLLAMLSVLAVFVPSFFMVGITRALFVPLSLAVGFAMISSFLLSSTLVPVMAVWLVKKQKEPGENSPFHRFQRAYGSMVRAAVPLRFVIIPVYLLVTGVLIFFLYTNIGTEMFPDAGAPVFRIRVRAPVGTRVEVAETRCLQTIEEIKKLAGPENVVATLGYVGQQPPQYVINSVFLWTSGPHEGVMDIALRPEAHIQMNEFKDKLRLRLKKALPEVEFSFEPGDLVSQIMNIGALTPISVTVGGPDLTVNRIFAARVKDQMAKIPYLRDLEYGQPQEYPTVDIKLDRELAGQMGLTPAQVGNSLVPATSSSRYILENFWMDRKSGVAYQVQVEIPQGQIASIEDVQQFPAMKSDRALHPLIGDLAKVTYGTCVGEYDRRNMMRFVSVTANISGKDLGNVGNMVKAAIKRAGKAPRGCTVEVGGQVPVLNDTFFHLFVGLGLAVVVIFLMLTAYFQSPSLAAVVLSTSPGIITGVLFALWASHTTLNVESFMGAIMSIGVGVSNAILLVAFSEEDRLKGKDAEEAAIQGAESRLRPILMTSIAMVSGMVPMALALGGGGAQSAPLGRAVIGGLTASTITALTILPLVFTAIQKRASIKSPSLHPDDRGE